MAVFNDYGGSTPARSVPATTLSTKDLLSRVLLRLESPHRSPPSFISSPLPSMSFYDLVLASI
ncbi:hypothetical protein Ahy_A09g046154 isoform F [Arachis hypogaea]|uniref:Uncharacterized protein n=1 Tax=Arachis hypogaea TaxID=3818 RepID=A0A445BP05_ARAHY|nr:hypothetical protein Ahy_A09g046154 isoform F [Arachis hypogaea]